MGVLLPVRRCKIFDEFSPSAQQEFFAVTEKKYLPYIDSFYYSVFLSQDLSDSEDEDFDVLAMLEVLRKARINAQNNPDEVNCYGFVVSFARYNLYDFCVSDPENFDVFFANNVPDRRKTPRIVIQLRSRYLWQEGIKGALIGSFRRLVDFISRFGLTVSELRENRIDYCWHTNSFNNLDFFTDSVLKKCVKTTFSLGQKVFNIVNGGIVTSYASFGRRSSNNIFFRCYNKTREVVEMQYKSFFIDIWHREGLISNYDRYVLEHAFSSGSFRSGVLIGRIQWYLEYGKDETLKRELKILLYKCYGKSDNSRYIEKQIHGVLPDLTTVVNFEFQTKRRFYYSCRKTIDSLEHVPVSSWSKEENKLMVQLNKIVNYRYIFTEYLTRYGCCLSFAESNAIKASDFDDSMYLSFWRRLRGTKMQDTVRTDVRLSRNFERRINIDKAKNALAGKIAAASVLLNGLNDAGYSEDASDALAMLNDNDIHELHTGKLIVRDTGEVLDLSLRDLKIDSDYNGYKLIKARRNRQYKPLFDDSEDINTDEVE